MSRFFLLIFICLTLSSCGTLKDIQEGDLGKTIGSFQLNPVQPNAYWYDGKSYEYNAYEIEITSAPVPAKILWNGKTIGTTPFVYRFSGVLDTDDHISISMIPVDEKFPAQEATLRVNTELPRKMHFNLQGK